MRNEYGLKNKIIFSLVKTLPCFSVADLAGVEKDRRYLKIFLSRQKKSGKLVRLKKGVYTARAYIDELEKKGGFSPFSEFLANFLHQPSYLSLDYILYQYHLLTDIPVNFTSVSSDKTAAFSNKLGNFLYHKIKRELFCGFEIKKDKAFIVFRATKTKALFDFLYLRKNQIADKKAFEELRLNLNGLKKKDFREFKKYLKIEGSKKMKKIFDYLLKSAGA